ncbi:MAG TPA: hypothetical protein VM537_21220 [Anaerolineae bacterium]|nr:hypothetical protein [Anaerolineae bacterium]
MTEAEKKRLTAICEVLRSLAERCQATASGIEQFPVTRRGQLNILWSEVVTHQQQVTDLITGGRGEREAEDADADAV